MNNHGHMERCFINPKSGNKLQLTACPTERMQKVIRSVAVLHKSQERWRATERSLCKTVEICGYNHKRDRYCSR